MEWCVYIVWTAWSKQSSIPLNWDACLSMSLDLRWSQSSQRDECYCTHFPTSMAWTRKDPGKYPYYNGCPMSESLQRFLLRWECFRYSSPKSPFSRRFRWQVHSTLTFRFESSQCRLTFSNCESWYPHRFWWCHWYLVSASLRHEGFNR